MFELLYAAGLDKRSGNRLNASDGVIRWATGVNNQGLALQQSACEAEVKSRKF